MPPVDVDVDVNVNVGFELAFELGFRTRTPSLLCRWHQRGHKRQQTAQLDQDNY